MALREDEPVVVRILRVLEVVAQVLREQHGHQVGGGHPRGRMAGAGLRRGADRVDPQLLPQLAPELDVVSGHEAILGPSGRATRHLPSGYGPNREAAGGRHRYGTVANQ